MKSKVSECEWNEFLLISKSICNWIIFFRSWIGWFARKLLELFYWSCSQAIESCTLLFTCWCNASCTFAQISSNNQLHIDKLVPWMASRSISFSCVEFFTRFQSSRRLSRFGDAIHGIRPHFSKYNIESLLTDWTTIQLYNAKIVSRANIIVYEAIKPQAWWA